ncbi:hypothetical protein F1559_005184 [Cyanidiococcus yangmingshanensis]|uniref:Uncharacterized protein n=1 Tax=Cyanidiococcus yangmingshanensis TaxID=2690220 RepID=A0A7J7IPX1_9RHOD|nr:hypothetical protein F1559_005184 [Cyanidiococcus yangmingshanensis]
MNRDAIRRCHRCGPHGVIGTDEIAACPPTVLERTGWRVRTHSRRRHNVDPRIAVRACVRAVYPLDARAVCAHDPGSMATTHGRRVGCIDTQGWPQTISGHHQDGPGQAYSFPGG